MNDIVTEVLTDKRGAVVTVNEQTKLWFARSFWYERELKEGEAVDLAELKAWLLPRQYPPALNYAVSLLAVRARSTHEIRQKLRQRTLMEDTIDMVIYKLEKEKLVDDEVFARDYAASKARRQMGKQRILQELRLKGIGSDVAQRAVAQLDGDVTGEQAAALATKLVRRYQSEEPRKAMQKALNAMARRGYRYEESRDALNAAIQAIAEGDEDEDDEDGD